MLKSEKVQRGEEANVEQEEKHQNGEKLNRDTGTEMICLFGVSFGVRIWWIFPVTDFCHEVLQFWKLLLIPTFLFPCRFFFWLHSKWQWRKAVFYYHDSVQSGALHLSWCYWADRTGKVQKGRKFSGFCPSRSSRNTLGFKQFIFTDLFALLHLSGTSTATIHL